VNGASVNSFLRCENFAKELPLLNPDLVIFNLGINDATSSNFAPEEFKNQYLQLAMLFKKYNPNCAFIFVTNNDSYKKIKRGKYIVNKNGILVRTEMYKLAELMQGAIFDQFEIMGGLSSMEKWRVNKLAQNDRIHFTNAGYILMGDLFFHAFMDAKIKCDNFNKNNY
jgi:lysophospholipase L1-like esterase